nr:dUTPase [Calliteara abietis nucleopolyhedrovirus]
MNPEIMISYVKTSRRAGNLMHAAPNAAGLDLKSAESVVVPSRETVALTTDLIICLPPDTYGRISSVTELAFKHNIEAFAGTIDNDYRGIVKVLLRNFGSSDYKIECGDTIAQIVVQPYLRCDKPKLINLTFLETSELQQQQQQQQQQNDDQESTMIDLK